MNTQFHNFTIAVHAADDIVDAAPWLEWTLYVVSIFVRTQPLSIVSYAFVVSYWVYSKSKHTMVQPHQKPDSILVDSFRSETSPGAKYRPQQGGYGGDTKEYSGTGATERWRGWLPFSWSTHTGEKVSCQCNATQRILFALSHPTSRLVGTYLVHAIIFLRLVQHTTVE
jgi:hypothetical protein